MLELTRLWPRGGLWRQSDFLRLWAGQTISQFGTQVTLLALPLVAVLTLEASVFEVAVLSGLEYLPFIVFALPVGVWVDRLSRRPILIVGDIGRALALGSVPLAYALGVLSIWQLYAVAFVVGTLTVWFDVAYVPYLPSLVERDRLGEANAKLEVSRAGAHLTAPAVGGALVQAITAPETILVDALSFVASALFLARIKRRESPPRDATTSVDMRAELSAGIRYVLGHRYLRPLNACTASSNLFWGLISAILLVYAVRMLHLRPATIGIVFGLGNIGFLAGALLANRIPRRIGIGPAVIGSAVLFGPPLVLLPLARFGAAVPLLVAAWGIGGFGGTVYNVTVRTLVQSITPDRLLGRTVAVTRLIVWGTIPLGALLGGALAATIGLWAAMWIGAIGASLAFVPPLLSPVRSLRTIPAAATEPMTRPASAAASLGASSDA
jgi:MFS family permease